MLFNILAISVTRTELLLFHSLIYKRKSIGIATKKLLIETWVYRFERVIEKKNLLSSAFFLYRFG